MKDLLFLSYYTDNPVYRGYAEILKASFEKFNLRHEMIMGPAIPWLTSVFSLPQMWLDSLDRDEPVVWLDVDSEVLAYPEKLFDIAAQDADISLHHRYQRIWRNCTMILWPTDTCRRLLQRWVDDAATGKYGNHLPVYLTKGIEQEKITPIEIPDNYCCAYTEAAQFSPVVIETGRPLDERLEQNQGGCVEEKGKCEGHVSRKPFHPQWIEYVRDYAPSTSKPT